MHREAGEPPPEETRRLGTNVLGRGACVSPAGGTPLGVSAEPCCPHHVETRRISQHPTERLSDVCFYVGFSFSQKVLRYFLGALKCLVPFLFYASGSRRTSARRDAALRDKCARARGVRKPRRGDPFRGVGGALLSPPRRNTTNFAASDRTPVGCLLLRRFLLFPKSSSILFGSPEMPCALSFLCIGKPADNCQSGQLPYRNKKM